MKAVALLSAAALTLTVSAFPQGPSGAQTAKYVGRVLSVKKSCVARDEEQPRPLTITEKNGVGTKLRAGQQLQCVAGGSLSFRYVSSGDVVAVTQTPPEWFTVVNVPARPNTGPGGGGGSAGRPAGRVAEYYRMPSAEDLISMSHHTAGAGAAPSGGMSSQGYSVSSTFHFIPYSRFNVIPESFDVRWDTPSRFPITLSLRSASKDVVIWELKGVPGESFILVSAEARAALKRFRETNPGENVRLVASSQGNDLAAGHETVLAAEQIRLLPVSEEQLLNAELGDFEKDEEVERRLERADAFSHYGLFLEAADEYEAALKVSSGNSDLLVAATLAQCRVDNVGRAYELYYFLSSQIPSLDYSALLYLCMQRR